MKFIAKCSAFVNLSCQEHVNVCNPIPLNLTTPDVVMAKVYVILDHPSYVEITVMMSKLFPMFENLNSIAKYPKENAYRTPY